MGWGRPGCGERSGACAGVTSGWLAGSPVVVPCADLRGQALRRQHVEQRLSGRDHLEVLTGHLVDGHLRVKLLLLLGQSPVLVLQLVELGARRRNLTVLGEDG